jgi:hypothetical protein
MEPAITLHTIPTESSVPRSAGVTLPGAARPSEPTYLRRRWDGPGVDRGDRDEQAGLCRVDSVTTMTERDGEG